MQILLFMCHVFSLCSTYDVTYAFKSYSTLYIILNVQKLVARNRRDIWSLSDCSEILTQNFIVRKRTLKHFAELTKWLSWIVSTSLYDALDCMLLSCHIGISEWIHTLYFPDCPEILCSKQPQNIKFKWLQQDSNLLPTTHYHVLPNQTLNHFAKLIK